VTDGISEVLPEFVLRVLLVGCVVLGQSGTAGADRITWGQPEAIETQIPELSGPAGTMVVWSGGAWHVVYPRAGGVRYAWRDAAGWHLAR